MSRLRCVDIYCTGMVQLRADGCFGVENGARIVLVVSVGSR